MEEIVFGEGQHYTIYEATQQQRKFERAIRNQKRKILVDETLEDKEQLQTDRLFLRPGKGSEEMKKLW